jgi:hypothetical protein
MPCFYLLSVLHHMDIIITVYISAEGEIILQFANNAHIMFIGPA